MKKTDRPATTSSSILQSGLIGVFDQLLFAAVSLVGLVWAARSLETNEVGALATYFVAATLFGGLFRSAFGEPLSLLGDLGGLRDAVCRSVLASSRWLVASIALAIPLTYLTMRGVDMWTFGLLTFFIPAIGIHEMVRAAAYASKQAAIAMLIDTFILGTLVSGFLIGTAVPDHVSQSFVVLFWFGPFVLVGLVAAVVVAISPRPQSGLGAGGSRPYVLEYVLGAGAGNAWFLTSGALVGQTAVATLRLAQAVFGVFSSIQLGLRAALVRPMAEVPRREQERYGRRIGVGLAAFTLACTGLAALGPTRLWVSVLGELGVPTRTTVLWFGVFRTAEFLVFGEFLRFRAAELLTQWNRVRVVGVVLTGLFVIPLARLFDVQGVVLAMTIGSIGTYLVARRIVVDDRAADAWTAGSETV